MLLFMAEGVCDIYRNVKNAASDARENRSELICCSAILSQLRLRVLPQQETLNRDLHCILQSSALISGVIGRPGGSPSPDTPPSGQISLS